MPNCNVCGAQYSRENDSICPRCGADNSYWRAERGKKRRDRVLNFFNSIWGVMAIIIVAFPGVLMVIQGLYRFYWGVDYRLHPAGFLGDFLGWYLSFLAVIFIYSIRFQLWHYNWLRTINRSRNRGPSVPTASSLLIAAGVLLMLLYLTIAMFWRPPAQPSTAAFDVAGVFQRILVPGIYSLIYLSFGSAFMLMSAMLYIARMTENVGQPIYMNTDRLAWLVLRSVKADLDASATTIEMGPNTPDGPQPPTPNGGGGLGVTLRIAGLERTARGGIKLTVNRIKLRAERPTDESNHEVAVPVRRVEEALTPRWQHEQTSLDASPAPKPDPVVFLHKDPPEIIERRYEVEADQFGQIRTLKEIPIPR